MDDIVLKWHWSVIYIINSSVYFLGLLIEYWKLTKAFNVTFHRPGSSALLTSSSGTIPGMKFTIVDKLWGVPLPIVMKWKLSDSYTTSKTKEYDAIATTHLLYAVIPIVFGYSIYSLIHISVGLFVYTVSLFLQA
jgi:hypothetical protein